MAPPSLTEMPPNFIIKDSVKMIVFCMTLVLLHQGYTLVPVTTVQLGEPATFTCAFLDDKMSQRQLQWYKQSAGDNLKSIVTLRKHVSPMYGSVFSASRMVLKIQENMSNLTIFKTISEDEGMYHCAVVDWINVTWSGTYLMLKGNPQRTSNYTVVQWPTVSDPVRPGDSVTLQCSVLSESDSKICPGGRSVFWFKTGLDKSHPNIIYTDENRHDECEMRSDSQKSCVYRLNKDVNSIDAGTYYCAVAMCGEIIFGDGTKLDIQETSIWSQMDNGITVLLCAVLAISLIVIALLIYTIKKNKCNCYNAALALQKNSGDHKSQERDEWIYSIVIFTMIKTDSGAIKDIKTPERARIYAAAEAFGFD